MGHLVLPALIAAYHKYPKNKRRKYFQGLNQKDRWYQKIEWRVESFSNLEKFQIIT